MAVMVIGAGFDGTGTDALASALARLGLGPCLDLAGWQARPGPLADWEQATDGAAVDWAALLQGYRSTAGWPACRFWRELTEEYPAARVVLTVREPGSWYRTASATLFAGLRDPPKDGAGSRPAWRLLRKMILEQTFGGGVDDAALAADALAMHQREVKVAVPADRLLVYEVGHGWEPLCRFLDVAVPNDPFPSATTTA